MRAGYRTALVTAMLLAGCASSAPAGESSESSEPLLGEQLVDYANLYSALRELRPTWVRRAREVFVDNELAGDIGVLRRSTSDEIRFIELVPSREVVRRFGPCQAPAGTGVIDTPRDPQCGTRPVIHIVRYLR